MPCTGSVKSGRLDHVVLLVAAQAVLRAERGADAAARAARPAHRASASGRASRKPGAPAAPRALPASGSRSAAILEQAVDAEFHAVRTSQREPIGVMEVRLARRMAQRPVGEAAGLVFDHRCECRGAAAARRQDPRRPRDPASRRARGAGGAAATCSPGALRQIRSGVMPAAVIIEVIRRPVERGREVEFVVAARIRPPPRRPRSRCAATARRRARPARRVGQAQAIDLRL